MDLKRVSVLIVDDNKNMRTLLSEVLRGLGVRSVYEAQDGQEGLSALVFRDVDIILIGALMRPMDSLQFTRRLRALPSRQAMRPIILVSANSTRRRALEARDAGVNCILAAPFTVKGVADRVVEVIKDSRPFVRTPDYFGPDRRRRQGSFAGQDRRAAPSS